VKRTKVIIDTDTGIDDAMGVVYGLLSPELDVLAVTTVFGNVDVEKTTRNSATILQLLGRTDVPLAKGAAKGLLGVPRFNPEVHGEDGVGNSNFPDPAVKPVRAHAAQLIIDVARHHPGEVTLIGLGPLTNIALAASLDPELPSLVNRVVWMGGAVSVPGNVTPVAEADAAHDPESAAIVLAADWPVTIIGLDVTDSTLLRQRDLDLIRRSGSPAAAYVARIVPFYMNFYSPLLGERACAMHSPLTVAAVAHPDLIVSSADIPMTVELSGSHTRGMTVADRRPGQDSDARSWLRAKRVCYATDVDRERFIELFVSRVTQAAPSGEGARPEARPGAG
jgi:purine nucleosidase